ncbi:MAG: hypothetical protein P8K68_11925, partial [Algibacter sp.]|uniref:hypothetical protein n=1 Tax=Algibacter sp. TaxID=1872428 RepID=UPI00261428D9
KNKHLFGFSSILKYKMAIQSSLQPPFLLVNTLGVTHKGSGYSFQVLASALRRKSCGLSTTIPNAGKSAKVSLRR